MENRTLDGHDRIRILCVDDEASILKALRRIFLETAYEVMTAASGEEGLNVLAQSPPIQVVISDYRMPGMTGVDFLREVRRRWPETVRIVLSGFADTASIVAAINEGEIYRFIPKPWNDEDLKIAIANAVERFALHRRNDELAAALLEKNAELERINAELERLVEERTRDIAFQGRVLQGSQTILDVLPVAVIGLDMHGLIVWYNRWAQSLFGAAILGEEARGRLPAVVQGFIGEVIARGTHARWIELDGIRLRAKGAVMHAGDQHGVILVFDVHEGAKEEST